MPLPFKKNVGVIGLGVIGSRVARHLRASGYRVYVYDKTPKPVFNFLGAPTQVADHCHIIQLFLGGDQDLREVMASLKKTPLTKNHLIINSTTAHPKTLAEIEQSIAEDRATLLHAPFSGSKTAAEQAALTYYLGGNKETQKRAIPVLTASAREILTIGTMQDAAIVELSVNGLMSTVLQGVAEALALVQNTGIEKDTLLQVLQPSDMRSPLVQAKLPAILEDRFEPNFSLANMANSVKLAVELATEAKAPTPALESVSTILQAALQKGWGELDVSAVSRMFLCRSEGTPIAESAAPLAPQREEKDARPIAITSEETAHPHPSGEQHIAQRTPAPADSQPETSSPLPAEEPAAPEQLPASEPNMEINTAASNAPPLSSTETGDATQQSEDQPLDASPQREEADVEINTPTATAFLEKDDASQGGEPEELEPTKTAPSSVSQEDHPHAVIEAKPKFLNRRKGALKKTPLQIRHRGDQPS